MVESVPAKAWPRKTEAISARIIPWAGDTLGVAYDFPDGSTLPNRSERMTGRSSAPLRTLVG